MSHNNKVFNVISSARATRKPARALFIIALGVLLAMLISFLWPEMARRLMNTENFMPHKYCYLLNAKVTWLHVVSDSSIALSYLAISLTLLYLVQKAAGDIPFQWMFLAFGVFIVACGATHFMEVVTTLWAPVYWLSGEIKGVTAFASVLTAILFPPLVPRVLGLISAARIADQRQRELEHTHAELERRTQELARSNSELQQFAYIASHDLQEPLRMVSSYTQLLRKRYNDKLDADANEFIEFAVDGAERMQSLISDLLAYSRLGTRGEEFRPVRMERVYQRALENLRVAVSEQKATVTADDLPKVTGDEGQLVQLLQNLISNGIKFRSKDDPRVRISARREGPNWVFSVSDNGIGIDPSQANRIFEMFQRLHTREEYPGTGIGLAICKKIVERHGGRIWAESQPGKGSTFYFTLPAGTPSQP